MSSSKQSLIPGLMLTALVALVAFYVHKLPFAPFTIDGRHPIDALLIAIIIGMAIRNLSPLPRLMGPGIKCSVKKVLPFAIVLMGAKLDFNYVMQVSAQALLLSVICVIVALTFTLWLCKRIGVGQKLGLLIGIGTAICGGTAIAVSAPIIEADENDTAFAITTITIFGLAAIFVFPALGHALGMSQTDFGIWAGISIQATPQVMAAGFAYGESAGEIAVIVKLVRVLLLAPMLVFLGAWYAREKRRQQQAYVSEKTSWSTLFPPFIIGFLALALANTSHLLPDFTLHFQQSALWSAGDVALSMRKAVTGASLFLITMAMAGVGLGVHLRTLRKTGLKALYVGFFSAALLSLFALGMLKIML